MLFTSCKKHQVKVVTNSVSSITPTTAITGGEVTDDGGQAISSFGVCWGTSSSPVLGTGNYTEDGSGKSSFTSSIKKLKQSTLYYVRAYAKYSGGIVYGNEYSFVTQPFYSATIPIVLTGDYSSVDLNQRSLTLNGEIGHKGGSDIQEQGFVWNLKGGPSIVDNKVTSNLSGDLFTSQFSFEVGKTYYLKAYAVNSYGVAYGEQITIMVEGQKPKVNSLNIIELDSNYIICSSEVTNTGGSSLITRGVCWSSHSNPTINDNKTDDGNSLGAYTSTLSGLLPNTQYYLRSYATNSDGTSYGSEVPFKTIVGTLYIGLKYKGGIIFYLDPSKKGGLVVSESDISTSSSWGCYVDVKDAVSKLIYSGKTNSDAIMLACGNNNGAVKLCDDYVVGKYDDWFLPSYNEVELIYKNLKETDKQKFSVGYYWTSTQKDASTALRYGFLGGNYGEADKSTSLYVRAVRKF